MPKRLATTVAGLITEGYEMRKACRLDGCIYVGLHHTRNGNRITVIESQSCISMLKNGVLISSDIANPAT